MHFIGLETMRKYVEISPIFFETYGNRNENISSVQNNLHDVT